MSSESKSFVYCAGRRWFIRRVLDDRNPEVWEVEWDVSWRSYEDLPNAAESIDRYESGHQDGASPRDRRPHHDSLPYDPDRLYPGGHLPLGEIPPPGLPNGEATWDFNPEPGKDYALAAIEFFQRLYPEGSHKGHLRRYMLRPTKRGLQFRQEYTNRVNMYRSEQKNAAMMLIKGALQPRACNRCREGRGPFLYCVTLTGFGNGACASCMWDIEGPRCDWHETPSPLIESFHMIAVFPVNHVDFAEHEAAGTDQRSDPPALPNLASRQPALATDASPTHGCDGDTTSIEDAEKMGSAEAAPVDAEDDPDLIVEDHDSEYHPQSSSSNTPAQERPSSMQPAASTLATETTSPITVSKDVDNDVDWDTPEYSAGHSSPRSTRHRASRASTECEGSRPLRRTRVGIASSTIGGEASISKATLGRFGPNPQPTQPVPPPPPPPRVSASPMTSRNHRIQPTTAMAQSKATPAGRLRPLSESTLNKRAGKQPVRPRQSLGKRPRGSEDEVHRVSEPPLTTRLAGAAASSTIVPAASPITIPSASGGGPATTPQPTPLNPSFPPATHSEAVPSIASPPNPPLPPLHTTPPVLVHKPHLLPCQRGQHPPSPLHPRRLLGRMAREPPRNLVPLPADKPGP
ncbi:hypothetical protein LTR35_014739 [Friedmanniomyces endolithicus]|nr:hypothetical protein LTR35_014739 [Friedmanniomyces endolithicus]KAK0271847.1 hypothetical protein LTS00_016461 [Friedmanniomyces endolithicus]